MNWFARRIPISPDTAGVTFYWQTVVANARDVASANYAVMASCTVSANGDPTYRTEGPVINNNNGQVVDWAPVVQHLHNRNTPDVELLRLLKLVDAKAPNRPSLVAQWHKRTNCCEAAS